MNLFAAGINYKRTPVHLREKFALRHKPASVGSHRDFFFEEKVVLSTCNRSEVMFCAHKPVQEKTVRDFFHKHFFADAPGIEPGFYIYQGYDALRHMCRVASGLDSAVMGESEIFGQMKDAWRRAREAGEINARLDSVFQEVFRIGKLVRSATGVSRGAVSVAGTAIDVAEAKLGLRGRTVLVIGAGKMNKTAAAYMVRKGAGAIFLANRTFARAEQLARDTGGKAVRFDCLDELLKTVDAVFSATRAPHFILTPARHGQALSGRSAPLLIIDMAVPRDVDPGLASEAVSIINIDQLKQEINVNTAQRKKEAIKAEKLITESLVRYASENWN